MTRLVLVAAAAAFLSLSACDAPPATGPRRPLPSYAGHAADLFDDSIDPAAIGLSLDVRVDPASDKALRERTQVGDAVVRAKITTVTAKPEDNGTRYLMGLKSGELIYGHFPPGETFELSVGQLNPAAGLLKSMQERIVGRPVLCFVRAFVRPDGDFELHFHIAPDTKEQIAAVRNAAALSGL